MLLLVFLMTHLVVNKEIIRVTYLNNAEHK